MAEYITLTDIATLISNSEITSFLDDNRDGVADVGLFDSIVTTCSDMTDAFVSSIYTVPFTGNIPALIKTATLYFVAESLYARRLTPDEKNPFKKTADLFRTTLSKIGAGELPIDASVARAFDSIVYVALYSRLNDTAL